jgi:non-ribosomal peptide synthetase component F
MFGALLCGGRLVIVPRTMAADPDRLLNLIEKHRVTVLCQPPSAFYLLADAMVRARRPTSLRYVLLGGEAIKTENLNQWCGHYGEAH